MTREEARKRLSACDICGVSLAPDMRRCGPCMEELSAGLATLMEETPEPVAVARAKPGRGPRAVSVSDDEAIRMWELYDEGYAVSTIAVKLGRGAPTVQRALEDLDVWEGPVRPGVERKRSGTPRGTKRERPNAPRSDSKARIDSLIERMLDGKLTGQEQRIADALARIGSPGDDVMFEQRSFNTPARSAEHVKASARGPVVMSARQRANDKVGPVWRAVIRRDLRRAGLLPRGH